MSGGFADDLDHDARGQGMAMETGAMKVVEGKHFTCFQAKQDPAPCTDPTASILHMWMEERKSTLLMSTPVSSKASSPWHWFYPHLF